MTTIESSEPGGVAIADLLSIVFGLAADNPDARAHFCINLKP